MDKVDKPKETVMVGNHYPIFKATVKPETVIVVDGPYVIFSKIQGFVPAIDIDSPEWPDPSQRTMIVNQMSVGKAMFGAWQDNIDQNGYPYNSLYGKRFNISRVAEGRMAPYKIEVLP